MSAFIDRRGMTAEQRARREQLTLHIKPVGRETWPMFSKYHYLSDRLPGGFITLFGLFIGDDQIGFQCFANYVPTKRGSVRQMHSNRTVIHPDYAGLGIGIKLINATSFIMVGRGYDVRAKFSSTPVYRAMSKFDCWRLLEVKRQHSIKVAGNMSRRTGFRRDVKVYSFVFDVALYDPARDGVTFA